MKKMLAAILVAAPLSLAHGQVSDPGWYLGLGLGQAQVDDPMTGQQLANITMGALSGTSGTGTMTTDEDDKDSAWKITGGLQISDVVGLEAHYADLGEASANASGTGGIFLPGSGTFTGTVSSEVTYDTQVVGLAATLGYPVADRVRLYGKFGAFYFETEAQITARINGSFNGGPPGAASSSESEEESGNSLFGGVGMGFAFSRDWQLVAEWERYTDVDSVSGESDVDIISASIQYRF